MAFNEVKFLKRFKEELAAHYNKHYEVQGKKSKPRKGYRFTKLIWS